MNPFVIPTMAGSRTYVGPAYYNSRQPVTYATGSAYWLSSFCPLLQYTRNSCGVGWAVSVCLYPAGTTTIHELVGPPRTSSSGTLVVLSSRYRLLLLLAILNKKVESNVTAGMGH